MLLFRHRGDLNVGVFGFGAYEFDSYIHHSYLIEKIQGLGDLAGNVADFINDQVTYPDTADRQGTYESQYCAELEMSCALAALDGAVEDESQVFDEAVLTKIDYRMTIAGPVGTDELCKIALSDAEKFLRWQVEALFLGQVGPVPTQTLKVSDAAPPAEHREQSIENQIAAMRRAKRKQNNDASEEESS